MKRLFYASALALLVSMAALEVRADVLDVGVDFSTSGPYVHENGDGVAKLAGAFLYSRIVKMKIGDVVRIRSIGEYGLSNTQLHIEITISNRKRPRKVASAVSRLVSSIPRLVREGKLRAEPTTNILGFLESQARALNCEKTPTTVILLSDGIEHSVYGTESQTLSGKAFPAPSSPYLKGCNLEIRGLAQQQAGIRSNPKHFRVLEAAWSQYARSAGVQSFRVYSGFTG